MSNVSKFRSQTIDPAINLLKCFPVCRSDGGMKIEWVDNTHALGVFSNEMAGMSPHCTMVVVLGLRLKDE